MVNFRFLANFRFLTLLKKVRKYGQLSGKIILKIIRKSIHLNKEMFCDISFIIEIKWNIASVIIQTHCLGTNSRFLVKLFSEISRHYVRRCVNPVG